MRTSNVLAGPAPDTAPRLLGWRLRIGDLSATIAETEAYHGEDDLACHAAKGRTPRSDTLYAEPGTLYVYLCYGIHHLLNLVCDQPGIPSAVLIRGVLIDGVDPRQSNGPGKVTRLLGLTTQTHNRLRLGRSGCPVRLLSPVDPRPILRTGPRVGVDYAGPVWAAKPWRWWISGFPAVGIR